jgi:hypothetical protein
LLKAYETKQRHVAAHILRKYGVDPQHIDRHLARAVMAAVSLDQQGAAAAFGSLTALSNYSPQFAANFTSPGSCTVTSGLGVFPRSQARSKSLDAGPVLTFQGPQGTRTMQTVSKGLYQVITGSGFTSASVPPGAYSITGTHGADIGPFTASLNIAASVIWTNKSAVTTLNRSQPVTVTWSGGPSPGYVLIGGTVHASGMNTAFLCVEDSQKESFTIPAQVLSALPPAGQGHAYMFIGPHPFTNPVSIPGVDLAYFSDGSSDYAAVTVR